MELIITEKPSAAKKIAEGLSSGKPKKTSEKGVPVYEVDYNGKKIKIVCAVGHLFTVDEKSKSFNYPVFDIEWAPSYKDKGASYSKKYFDVIKKTAKEADSFTVACDYDVEGEVIGLNILRYICKQKDGKRMKFSTLVKEDVIKSYESKLPSIDWGQAIAGETRHFLDWMYGINLSRALMTSIKKAGSFKVMSSGRVQSPALKIIVDRELEIKAFKPEPYWQIFIQTCGLKAIHETDKFWDENEAKKVFDKIQSQKECMVKELKDKEYKQQPPNPFDLGSLQSEAYKIFKFNPKRTLQIAQELYLKGITSYPRTSSQKLPKELGYTKILSAISKISRYKDKAQFLLNLKSLSPNEGKKTDPAHPAIYPTGLPPGKLGEDETKLYDLIVKRFFATFGKAATRKTSNVTFDVVGEVFSAKGTKTIDKGWHELYEPYVKFKEEEMPELEQNKSYKIDEHLLEDKQTEPPKRYTPASLISELEKRGLGTKATRADIIQSLYDRGYLHEKSIEATDLGIHLVSTLKKYVPEILDEELTRLFEEEMELIREQKMTQDQVLAKAKDDLSKHLEKFKSHEKEVGKELLQAVRDTQHDLNKLGNCPNCDDGELMIRKGKYGSFAACNNYPDCKTTMSLPKGVMIKGTEEVSPSGFPMVQVITRGKRPQIISLNPKDNIPEDKSELVDRLEKEGYTDPQSGIEMTLRYGFYGPFLAAKNYPKEKKILSLDQVKF